MWPLRLSPQERGASLRPQGRRASGDGREVALGPASVTRAPAVPSLIRLFCDFEWNQ